MIILYTKYNYIIREFKSKEYIHWFKLRYPIPDAHHLLNCRVDYLLYPVDHQMHLNKVRRNKAYYFELWLKESVDLFIEYVNERFFEKFNQKLILPDYEPETLRAIFQQVGEWKNERD